MAHPLSAVSRVLESVSVDQALLEQLDKLRRVVTVFFSDLRGSTSYFEKFGDAAGVAMVYRCHLLHRKAIDEHHGHLVKTIGDGVMAYFEDPGDAVAAAIKLQKELHDPASGAHDILGLRIGLNLGHGIVKTDDVFGDVVNVASRLQNVANTGQIAISVSVKEAIDTNKYKVRRLGIFQLKGKALEQEVFEAVWNDEPPKVMTTHFVVRDMMQALATKQPKLQHLSKDGTPDATIEVVKEGITIGTSNAKLNYGNDPKLAPMQARISLDGQQVRVENLNPKVGEVWLAILAPYTLSDGDAIALGGQLFQFRCEKQPERVASTVEQVAEAMQAPPAYLVAENEDGRRLNIANGTAHIGRTKGEFTFPHDVYLSRSHARIHWLVDSYYLEDLGSRNGSFVRVEKEAPVPAGGKIRVGSQLFSLAE